MLIIEIHIIFENRKVYFKERGGEQLNMFDVEKMKKIYFDWIDKKIQFVPSKNQDYMTITTPFLDMYNDYIELVIAQGNTSKYIISDDGYTINELGLLDINLNRKSKRRDYFQSILINFGVKNQNNELVIEFDDLAQFPDAQNRLTQCMLQAFDLLQTSKNSVIKYFKEDVTNYFIDNNIPVGEDLSLLGKSGRNSKFDIVVGRTRKKPQQAIKVVNTPINSNIANPLFRIIDVRESQPKTEFSVIANNINSPVSSDFKSAFKNYNIPVYSWSEREQWLSKFKLAM